MGANVDPAAGRNALSRSAVIRSPRSVNACRDVERRVQIKRDDLRSAESRLRWRLHISLTRLAFERYNPVGYVSGVSPAIHRLVGSKGSSARVLSM